MKAADCTEPMLSSYTHFQEGRIYSQDGESPWNMRITVEASQSYREKAVPHLYEKKGKWIIHCSYACRVECAHQI